MSNGNHIRAVGPDAAQNPISSPNEDSAGNEEAYFGREELLLTADDVESFEETTLQSNLWIVPTLAVLAIVGWTAFFIWTAQAGSPGIATTPLSLWADWIIDWSVPVLLICVLWLLALRNSRAEVNAFGQTASMLSRESRHLEDRLSVVNRELSLAREFLASQSRELESLGRMAADRIGEHADVLQGLIRENGEQIDTIHGASETALANMNRLRDDLPVIAASARDVSNQIGSAGRTAKDQLNGLVSGFEQLDQFGRSSGSRIAAVDAQVRETLSVFEADLARIEQSLCGRYEALRKSVGTYRSELDSAESEATAALSERVGMLQTETKAIAAALRAAEMDAMERLESSKNRFCEEVAKTAESLDQLDREAIAASHRRMKELHEEAIRFDEKLSERDRRFSAEIARRQDEFATRETEASDALAQRLADVDAALAQRREAQITDTERLVAHSTAMTAELDQLRTLIGEISEHGGATRETLSEGLDELGRSMAERRDALEETKAQLADLTEAGISLLKIIQSGTRHSREDLAGSIEQASGELRSVEQRASTLSGLMFATREKAEGLGDYLIETNDQINQTDRSIEDLKHRLVEQTEDALARLSGLRGGFARLVEDSETSSGRTQEQMRAMLDKLEEAIAKALAAIDQTAREKIGVLATTVSKDAVADIERTLREESAASIEQLENAAAQASGAGREATVQLRDQLAKVNELTVNLETRVARARERAQEQVDNDFARRMALISDNLNSNAIDIASALSTEVADTAWDAYLKGDRGIFTRRAVRLTDKGEARAIADLYKRDNAFKNAVSRYIHDFEAMLRSMLSTRDGNALAITILGSDSGKLYVVLAQALERIRA